MPPAGRSKEKKLIAQWTAATTLQRFREILAQEMDLTDYDDIDKENLTLENIEDLFKERIVRDAMPSGARHELTKPTKPKRLPTESLDVGG